MEYYGYGRSSFGMQLKLNKIKLVLYMVDLFNLWNIEMRGGGGGGRGGGTG